MTIECSFQDEWLVSYQSSRSESIHKIRPILDLLNRVFHNKYSLAMDHTVNKSMLGFEGRSNLVQYMPSKKMRHWEAKLFLLAAADTGFTNKMILYSGKK